MVQLAGHIKNLFWGPSMHTSPKNIHILFYEMTSSFLHGPFIHAIIICQTFLTCLTSQAKPVKPELDNIKTKKMSCAPDTTNKFGQEDDPSYV